MVWPVWRPMAGTPDLFPARLPKSNVADDGAELSRRGAPCLYRAILDRVAALEIAGERVHAARLRTEATDAYSRAWDERAQGDS